MKDQRVIFTLPQNGKFWNAPSIRLCHLFSGKVMVLIPAVLTSLWVRKRFSSTKEAPSGTAGVVRYLHCCLNTWHLGEICSADYLACFSRRPECIHPLSITSLMYHVFASYKAICSKSGVFVSIRCMLVMYLWHHWECKDTISVHYCVIHHSLGG